MRSVGTASQGEVVRPHERRRLLLAPRGLNRREGMDEGREPPRRRRRGRSSRTGLARRLPGFRVGEAQEIPVASSRRAGGTSRPGRRVGPRDGSCTSAPPPGADRGPSRAERPRSPRTGTGACRCGRPAAGAECRAPRRLALRGRRKRQREDRRILPRRTTFLAHRDGVNRALAVLGEVADHGPGIPPASAPERTRSRSLLRSEDEEAPEPGPMLTAKAWPPAEFGTVPGRAGARGVQQVENSFMYSNMARPLEKRPRGRLTGTPDLRDR